MFGLIMFSKMFTGSMQSSLHRGNCRVQGLRDFPVAAPLLHKGEKGAVLRSKLFQSMFKCIKLLGINGPLGFRHVLVLGGEGKEDAAKLLAAKMVDAGVSGQTEKPGLELRGSLEPVEGANHFYEYLLG